MQVLLDLDHTLLDTSGFYDQLPAEPSVFKDTFEELYLQGDYSVEVHAQMLREKGSDVRAEDIHEAYCNAPDHIYDQDILKKMSEMYDVSVVTRATHKGWQEKKAEVSGVNEIVDEVNVVKGSASDEWKTKEIDGDILVDDRKKEHRYSDTEAVFLFDADQNTLGHVMEELESM